MRLVGVPEEPQSRLVGDPVPRLAGHVILGPHVHTENLVSG